MVFNSLFFQLLLVGLSIAITIVYVQPTFIKIGAAQDSIIQYQTEREKIVEVNKKLNDLVTKVNNISAADQKALLIYMPETLDSVAVSRDIYNMSTISAVFMNDIDYSQGIAQPNQGVIGGANMIPVKHKFSVNVTGTYSEIKSFLLLLEQNNYPLEVHELKITSSEKDDLIAEMEIISYSRI